MIKFYNLSILLLFLFLSFNQQTYAQNEFYNNGGIVYLNAGSGSSTPTLFVNGNIINQNGTFTNNNSFLELKGDITNNASTYHYVSQSGAIERLSGSGNQTIKGTWNGTASNQDQFYNLKIYKTSATGEIIILDNALTGNSVNINPSGTLNFESTNGIVRTQSSSSTSPFTGNYTNTLYVQNPATTAIVGHNTGSGAVTKYVEGKLRRQVNSTGTYFFPVGVEKSGLDGMEALSVTMNSLTMPSGSTTGLLSYIQPAANPTYSGDLVTNGDVLFYDIGYFTNPAMNNFSQCTGGPDGHDDVAVIDQAITHEWIVSPNVVPTSVNYNISVLPGTVLESQINYATMGATCNSTYAKAQYLARDGKIGGNGAVGPTINYWVPGVTGYYQRPTLKTLSGQTGFSRFRVFGASDNNTSLPVELTKFTLTPINNEYFSLNWETASELNNAGFYIQRSKNGAPFENVGWIAGHGTSSIIHQYSFADRDIEHNTIYYYKLMQLDNDNSFKYSNTLSGILDGASSFDIFSIIPNPANINPEATLFAPENGNVEVTIFDILGQKMKADLFALNKGNNKIIVDMTNLATATYLVKFNFNNNIITKKIVKN